ncbi:MAG: NAD(+) synthase [Clostridia bacterium]|nr:NAD(+) synthase [Clostridia bacterium]
MNYGFVKVAAVSIPVSVAGSRENSRCIIDKIRSLDKEVQFAVFPELCITAYTCGDLFMQQALLDSAEKALGEILHGTKYNNLVTIVGMPVTWNSKLYNAAIIIQSGKILGVVPKSYLPNYGEYYEKRWFRSGKNISSEITLAGNTAPFGDDLLFTTDESSKTFAVELCEDLWALEPPSGRYCRGGAHLIFNLSASNELVGKSEYRENLVSSQSARGICGYIYASASSGESTTDMVFGGHCIIAENGRILAKGERFDFNGTTVITEIDTDLLAHDRRKNNVFGYEMNDGEFRTVQYHSDEIEIKSIERFVDPRPFVPEQISLRENRCKEILDIQSTGLARRMKHTGIKKAVIGISGGLDSTLALIATSMALKKLDLPDKNILTVTMPGFGTTGRTFQNASKLSNLMKTSFLEIDITESCRQHFINIGHDETVHDLTFENVQARERTRILMDIAGKENALVVGTGDLSELALGWATYNGDHMSMYGINCSVPKTLVRYLIKYAAEKSSPDIRKVLEDIMDTPVSPELLPPKEGDISQITEDIVGPYELHDFFLFNMVRNGFAPEKIAFLAENAFRNKYEYDEIIGWLRIFVKRFFAQQFKRSCIPDGPKIGSVSLSPRGDWRMPSDACGDVWLNNIPEDKA